MHLAIIYLQVEGNKKKDLSQSFKVFFKCISTNIFLNLYISLLEFETNFLIFLSAFLFCIAIGVQMSLEMLEKRFWSIATQVLKLIYYRYCLLFLYVCLFLWLCTCTCFANHQKIILYYSILYHTTNVDRMSPQRYVHIRVWDTGRMGLICLNIVHLMGGEDKHNNVSGDIHSTGFCLIFIMQTEDVTCWERGGRI